MITREALYDEVWARPMTKVAAEFGVSGTALKKICDRHDVPTPARGYWAKLEHHKPVRKTPLPKLKDARAVEVRIVGGAHSRLPESVRQARAKALGEAAVLEPPTVDGPPADLAEHPALAATRKAIGKARAGADGFAVTGGRGVIGLKIAPGSADRALSVLGRLLTLAETQGYSVDVSDAGLRLAVDGEPVGFRVEEQQQKTPHQPSAAELKRKADNLRWGYSRDPWPTYDYAPSGRLALIITDNAYSGLRRTYAERKADGFESQFPVILAGFAEHAALNVANRLKAAEERRLRAEQEARRAREAAFKGRETRRFAFVDAIGQELETHARLLRVLAHLERADDERGRIEAMIGWVRQRLAMIEARLSPLFLDISAGFAEIDFDEARASARPDSGPHVYYAHPAALQLWVIDREKQVARSVSELDWVRADSEAATAQGDG